MKSKLLGMAFLITALSCTEKVSDKLSSAPTSSSSTTTVVKTYDFELVNTKGENLSHFMHQAGDSASDCKLTFTAIPKADNYTMNNRSVALDCILDVEESDLYYQGAAFDLKASEGMCEYVETTPFTFWQYQPGYTNRFVYSVECEDNSCHSSCGKTFGSFNDTANFNVFNTTELGDEITSDAGNLQKLCYFDHSQHPDRYGNERASSMPNCDEGVVRQVNLYLPGVAGDPANPCTTTYEINGVTENYCGGKGRACLSGPAEDFDVDLRVDSAIVYYNTDLAAINRSFDLKSPDELDKISNRWLANYNRACAAIDTNPSDLLGSGIQKWTGAGALANTTGHGVANTIYSSTYFAGYLTELWQTTANVTTNGLAITNANGSFKFGLTQNGIDLNSDGVIDAYAFATGPFRGVYGGASPYYQFRCLDKAYDTKAQIRLFIREWDRSFDKNADIVALNVVSDYYASASAAKMDSEGSYDLNDNTPWNNFGDWDDFLLSQYGTATTYDVYQTNSRNGTLINGNYNYFVGTPLTNATFTNFDTTNRIDSTCTEMSSPYDYGNFPWFENRITQ